MSVNTYLQIMCQLWLANMQICYSQTCVVKIPYSPQERKPPRSYIIQIWTHSYFLMGTVIDTPAVLRCIKLSISRLHFRRKKYYSAATLGGNVNGDAAAIISVDIAGNLKRRSSAYVVPLCRHLYRTSVPKNKWLRITSHLIFRVNRMISLEYTDISLIAIITDLSEDGSRIL